MRLPLLPAVMLVGAYLRLCVAAAVHDHISCLLAHIHSKRVMLAVLTAL